MNTILHFLKFQKFIYENGKYMLSIVENWNFEPIGYFVHTLEFLTLRKALLILLPLYL